MQIGATSYLVLHSHSSCPHDTPMAFQNASNVDAHGSAFWDITGHQIYQQINIAPVVQASTLGARYCRFVSLDWIGLMVVMDVISRLQISWHHCILFLTLRLTVAVVSQSACEVLARLSSQRSSSGLMETVILRYVGSAGQLDLENLQLHRPLLKYVREATDLPPASSFSVGRGAEAASPTSCRHSLISLPFLLRPQRSTLRGPCRAIRSFSIDHLIISSTS